MSEFVVKEVRSDDIYKKIMNAPIEKRDDIYRYDFMKQFEEKCKKSIEDPLRCFTDSGIELLRKEYRVTVQVH